MGSINNVGSAGGNWPVQNTQKTNASQAPKGADAAAGLMLYGEGVASYFVVVYPATKEVGVLAIFAGDEFLQLDRSVEIGVW